jgi:hypothetical protein
MERPKEVWCAGDEEESVAGIPATAWEDGG